MQRMINVKLNPYYDYKDLLDCGKPDFTMVNKVDLKFGEIQERTALKKAIYGDNADLGEDDILKSKDVDSVFAGKFVKDLSKYVNIQAEEMRKLREF